MTRPHRTFRLTVRLTPDERRRLARRAVVCGLTPSAYLRRLALGEEVRTRRRRFERAPLAQLALLAQDLGELAAVARRTGDRPGRRELQRTLERVRRAVRRIIELQADRSRREEP